MCCIMISTWYPLHSSVPAMKSWRDAWRIGDFAWLNVQLAPYHHPREDVSAVRLAQTDVLPRVGGKVQCCFSLTDKRFAAFWCILLNAFIDFSGKLRRFLLRSVEVLSLWSLTYQAPPLGFRSRTYLPGRD